MSIIVNFCCFFSAPVRAVGHGIRLEHVEIPNVVAVGDSAHLVCDVDLEQGDLYSVKWYKDNEEFYDWKPWRDPTVQTYHVEGVHVDVSCCHLL